MSAGLARPRVLVVDDRRRPRAALAVELRDAGFEVDEAGDGNEAWSLFLQAEPDAVVADLVMPRSDGLDLLSRIRARSDVPFILFTAQGTVQSAATAFKAGADDFVSSPEVEIEELVALIANAVQGSTDAPRLDRLEKLLVGKTRPLRRLRERISALAPLRTPVLACGEPGTGTSTVVRALHDLGSTAEHELVRIDSGQMPDDVSCSSAGAIFIDGIETLLPHAQEAWADRVASAALDGYLHQPRFLASSSNAEQTRRVEDRPYSELRSLLLRFALEMPPLRAIRSDIPIIADALVSRKSHAVGRKIRLSPAAREFLAQQPWPGNTRQLEQLLERAIAFSRGRFIRRQLLKELLDETADSLEGIRAHRDAKQRVALLHALESTGGNISRTAEALDKSRAAVYRLIHKHGITLRRHE